LLGIGNPLLDILLEISDKTLLDKYGLNENDAILAGENHIELFEEISTKDGVKYAPGGATQNTIRIFQWMTKEPKCASFLGAINNDKFGKILQDRLHREGVNASFQINPDVKTGTCAVLLYNHQRSLCADLGAASTFEVNQLDVECNKSLIDKAKFYYISGYFITSCFDAIMKVAKFASETNRIFMLNLAAPFICRDFFDKFMEVVPYVDILFSNDSEAKELVKSLGYTTSNFQEIVQKINELPKANKTRPRTTIITRGADSILYINKGENVSEYHVPNIQDHEIIDTNGAGDAFCGGFIASFVQEKPIEKCMESGCFAASVVIRQQGCTLPSSCDYEF